MAQPTIARRLERKFIVVSQDPAILTALRAQTPAGWELIATADLDSLGDWAELLLYRFILLDLDEVDAFDPIDVIHAIRTEHMLQLAVFCFGGDAAIRDEMRRGRADRFYDRDRIVEMLPQFLAQYGWGGAEDDKS